MPIDLAHRDKNKMTPKNMVDGDVAVIIDGPYKGIIIQRTCDDCCISLGYSSSHRFDYPDDLDFGIRLLRDGELLIFRKGK